MGTGLSAVRVAVVVLASCSAAQADIFIGSTVNFNNGENGGWTNGQAADPAILPGGPGGASDLYLRVTSDGAGAGGKLTVFNNTAEWTGMFLTAGVVRIEMDLRNFDAQGRTLSMRIGMLASAGQGQPGWCTNAFSLPADGQWHHAVFLLTPATMVSAGSSLDWETAMQWVTQLRIFHSPTPSAVGVNFASSVGIDNIVALPTPETAGLLAMGGLACVRRRR